MRINRALRTIIRPKTTMAQWQKKAKPMQRPILPTPPVEPWRAWPEPIAALGVPVHIDKHVLCLNKPAGLLSQPDISVKLGQDACATQRASEWLGGRATCVHRIDKWATGCLLLARTPRASTRLARAFEQQQTTKHYLVIVRSTRGVTPPPEGSVGRIERSLSLDKKGNVHVDWPGGTKSRQALLQWSCLAAERGAAGGRHALLAVGLRGGFKHQIRALLGAEGLPLLGDVMYGGEAFNSHPSLLALHAATLQLKHPISGFPALMLRAPLPDEWKQHAPQAMRVAAERALTVPLGEGPLWDEQPEET